MLHLFFASKTAAPNRRADPAPLRASVRRPASRRKAFVILAMLVVVVILGLIAYRYADLMMQEYRSAHNTVRSAQLRSLAEAGVNYTALLLANPKSYSGVLQANPFDNIDVFHKPRTFTPADGVG